jgi:hypothetical protein
MPDQHLLMVSLLFGHNLVESLKETCALPNHHILSFHLTVALLRANQVQITFDPDDWDINLLNLNYGLHPLL